MKDNSKHKEFIRDFIIILLITIAFWTLNILYSQYSYYNIGYSSEEGMELWKDFLINKADWWFRQIIAYSAVTTVISTPLLIIFEKIIKNVFIRLVLTIVLTAIISVLFLMISLNVIF